VTAERARAVLHTERLLLRGWSSEDSGPFAALNADPEVMEHFPSTLGVEQSLDLIDRAQRQIEQAGYGFWAVEISASGRLAGFAGLSDVSDGGLAFAPAVEVGWRLAREFWGQGIAFEAAAASLSFGFGQLAFGEIVAYTARGNERSRALMERLGMRRDPAEDFLHPSLPAEHRLAPHVLYRLGRERWVARGRGEGREAAVPGASAHMLAACAGDTPTQPGPKN
jgi:RimJ/RimL family protein N-acetyltransferase